MRDLNNRLKAWKPIHLCWLFRRLGLPIPPYLIGGGSDFILEGGRIGNSDRTWAADEDVDVTNWNKANDFIIAAMVRTDAHDGATTNLRLEWRNVTDAGSWTVLGSSGELKYGATDLVDGNAVIHAEEGCTSLYPANHEDGRENEGSNQRSVTCARYYHEEDQHSVSPADADDGDEYEFRIYDVTDGSAVGVLACTITMATGVLVKIMDETEGLNEVVVRRSWAVRLLTETVSIVEALIKALSAPYHAKVGSFNIDTSKGVTETQSISGLGFQPKIVLFWWGGSMATGDSVSGGTYCLGFGAAISPSSRFNTTLMSDDAVATSNAARAQYNTDCIRVYSDGTPTLDGIMDFSSMDSDGFTLVVDDQFTNAYRISWLALGGDDLSNVYIGNKQTPNTTGEYSVTGVGFKPDAVILSTVILAGVTGSAPGGYHVVGMATGSNEQGVIGVWAQDGQVTSNTSGYGYNGETHAAPTSAISVSYRHSFVSFDDDGFTMNNLEGTGQIYYYFICLKGGQYAVGDLNTRTDGNDIEENVGFEPDAILFASVNRSLSTQDSPTDHCAVSLGAGTSPANRACAAIWDEDNLADTETAYANYDSAVYANVKDDAIQGLMDIKSIDSDGFTCVMDDYDPSACWVTYLAIGKAAAEAIVKIMSSTLGLSEADLYRNRAVRLMVETVSLADTVVRRMWSVRLKAETVGISDSLLRRLRSIRQMAETVSLQDAIVRRMWAVRIKAETVSIQDGLVKVFAIVKQMAETIGITDAALRIAGFVKVASETVGLSEAAIRRLWSTRQMAEAVNVTDAVERRAWAVRLAAATVGIQEAAVRRMWSVRQAAETIGIVEAGVLRKKIVKLISETIGLVEGWIKSLTQILREVDVIEFWAPITREVQLDSRFTKEVESESRITKEVELDSRAK